MKSNVAWANVSEEMITIFPELAGKINLQKAKDHFGTMKTARTTYPSDCILFFSFYFERPALRQPLLHLPFVTFTAFSGVYHSPRRCREREKIGPHGVFTGGARVTRGRRHSEGY